MNGEVQRPSSSSSNTTVLLLAYHRLAQLQTLGYLTLPRHDQASLHQRWYGNIPSSRATVPSVTRLTASQVIKVTDVLVILLHHGDRIVDGAIEVVWREKVKWVICLLLNPLGCVFVSLCGFTRVALSCSRNQAVLFACCVDVTAI